MFRKSAFTIVELLVVISIIILLLSIFLPTLTQTRATAEKAICATHLHQQGIGLAGYLVRNQTYPGHAARSEQGRIMAVWPTRIRTYAQGHDIFHCPSQPDGFRWQEITSTPGGVYATKNDGQWGYNEGERLLVVGGGEGVPFSYGYNDWGRWDVLHNPQRGLGGDLNFGILVPHLKKLEVTKPSKMIAIADNTSDGSWDFNIDPTNPLEYPGKIHFDGSNVLFCDGHVEWHLQSDLVNVNLSTPAGIEMSKLWNNHNKETADQN